MVIKIRGGVAIFAEGLTDTLRKLGGSKPPPPPIKFRHPRFDPATSAPRSITLLSL
jgi:hypothetical protein